MPCTCPPPPRRDPACPEHGIATLDVPVGLTAYDYPDGIRVLAATPDAAEAMHAMMLASRVHSVPAAFFLVTAPDERERCMVIEGDDPSGPRCASAAAWLVRADDGALDDYACVCGDHVRLVARAGYSVERIDAPG